MTYERPRRRRKARSDDVTEFPEGSLKRYQLTSEDARKGQQASLEVRRQKKVATEAVRAGKRQLMTGVLDEPTRRAAIRVLQEQVQDKDPRVAREAATKLADMFEREDRRNPEDRPHTIRFETAFLPESEWPDRARTVGRQLRLPPLP